MTTAVTIAITGVLAAISLLHVGWAFGLKWPAVKGASLAETVGGVRPGGKMHSRNATLLVATAIMGAAVLVAMVGSSVVPEVLAGPAAVAYLALALVFLLRGLSAYVPALWRRVEGTPFHRLNRLYFSPLCLLIAAGLIANIWNS